MDERDGFPSIGWSRIFCKFICLVHVKGSLLICKRVWYFVPLERRWWSQIWMVSREWCGFSIIVFSHVGWAREKFCSFVIVAAHLQYVK